VGEELSGVRDVEFLGRDMIPVAPVFVSREVSVEYDPDLGRPVIPILNCGPELVGARTSDDALENTGTDNVVALKISVGNPETSGAEVTDVRKLTYEELLKVLLLGRVDINGDTPVKIVGVNEVRFKGCPEELLSKGSGT
jgi:hypothetical protein